MRQNIDVWFPDIFNCNPECSNKVSTMASRATVAHADDSNSSPLNLRKGKIGVDDIENED